MSQGADLCSVSSVQDAVMERWERCHNVLQGNVGSTCSEILRFFPFFLFYQVEILPSLHVINFIQVRYASQQWLGMFIRPLEELHAQPAHTECVSWLLVHITGVLFRLHKYKSMC